MAKMRVVELFAGSATFAQEARAMGMEALSTDHIQYGNVDLVADVLAKSTLKKIVKFHPDILFASPPCTSFSIASCSHHFTKVGDTFIPKSSEAGIGMALALRVFEIIRAIKKAHGYVPVWFLENPTGMLRKMPFMAQVPILHKVTLCSYDDIRMKPTDINTNCKNWTPRPLCKNGGWGKWTDEDGVVWCLDREGQPCHMEARRGAKTGTQGLKGAHARAIMPPELCREILIAAAQRVTEKRTK